MNAVTLDRLLAYGPLRAVSHGWMAYDPEDTMIAFRDGEWRVRGETGDGEVWLGSTDDEQEARNFADRARAYLVR